MKKTMLYPFIAVAIGVPTLVAWLNDFVTLNGAKTIYAADCTQGAWRGGVCSGTLVAGDRYRFRALTAHNEVIFWIAGSKEPSGKLVPCVIESAKNWSCLPNADSPRSITLEMKHGQPVVASAGLTRPYHPVSKWQWLLLDSGFPYFHEADR